MQNVDFSLIIELAGQFELHIRFNDNFPVSSATNS